MQPKEKIHIIRDNLRAYADDIKGTGTIKGTFYYAALGEIAVYDKFLNGFDLDKDEQQFIEDALNFDKIIYGKHIFIFRGG